MKTTRLIVCSLIALGAIACTKEPVSVSEPLSTVTAKDGSKSVTAKIDHAAKTVKFSKFAAVEDITAVSVTFTAAEGASMVTPAEPTVDIDFSKQPFNIVVNDGVNDITYAMTAGLPDAIKSISVGGEAAVVEGTSIKLPFPEGAFPNEIEATVELRKGAVIDGVQGKVIKFDFFKNEKPQLSVKYCGTTTTYTVSLTGYNPADYLVQKAGWKNVNKDFGEIPAGIKIYKHTTLGADKNNTAFLCEVDKRAHMHVFGSGWGGKWEDYKSGFKATAEANPDVNVIIAGVDGQDQPTAHKGKLVMSPGSVLPVAVQEDDGTFNIYLQRHAPKEGGNGWEPFFYKLADDAKTVVDKKWLPKEAFGGCYMVIMGGKKLDEATRKATALPNGYSADWWTSPSAREFIGVTKDGKLYAFVSELDKNNAGGLHMEEVCDIMLAIGCDRAMTLEGSGSPDMLVNQKMTVRNKKRWNPDGSYIGEGKKYAAILGFN